MYISFTIQIYLQIIVHFIYICIMNARNSKYFVCIIDNDALVVEHTLKKLHSSLEGKIDNLPSYMTLFRRFSALGEDVAARFSLTIDGKEYWFQKVI